MKYGYRKPSIKKSVSSRTTGRINRNIKKATNPMYGKKGMGYINDPEKALYNKVYNKTTQSAFDEDFTVNMIVAIVIIVTTLILWWVINMIF